MPTPGLSSSTVTCQMSRWSRDDDREVSADRQSERGTDARDDQRDRDAPTRGSEGFARNLDLPRDEHRERVRHRGRNYFLNGSGTEALATVGAFRVVSPDDLDPEHGRDPWHGSWHRLAEQGLVEHVRISEGGRSNHLVTLSQEGKDLLEAHANEDRNGRRQEFYAGAVKPRELAHDAKLYRMFREEAGRIERAGGRVTRVVLDYELKRDYQRYLNRQDRPENEDRDTARDHFARSHHLPVVDDHVMLPDLRIEYETRDGHREHRDLELVTEHYSRGQLAGKAQAGFVRYAAGSSGQSGRGGTPHDPRHLERLA